MADVRGNPNSPSREHKEQPPSKEGSKDSVEELEPITNISTWSELAKYVTAYTPGRLKEVGIEKKVSINLDCTICNDKHIKLPSWVDGRPNATQDECEELCVLPCGHFFGRQCIINWAQQQVNNRVVPSCPTCRFELLHPVCGHMVSLDSFSNMIDSNVDYGMGGSVPCTRLHKLDKDNHNVFIDISDWDPKEADAEHNFGVMDECYDCEKEQFLKDHDYSLVLEGLEEWQEEELEGWQEEELEEWQEERLPFWKWWR
ncbi:hypothetical protein GGS24DRAFT_502537 [Hypoxylon argillaceum]|nr:hypothetical protein GGS24DRAFT_502537 [Hypoxylon argillaceum]KAI1148291.1 hypothetical protein F4825DRAFT_454641 [Nemania diffusa]